MPLPCLCQIDRALGRTSHRRFVDIESCDLSAQHRIVQLALRWSTPIELAAT
jgi:hypothetical protein